jgi:hypothetical protein
MLVRARILRRRNNGEYFIGFTSYSTTEKKLEKCRMEIHLH